EYVRSFDLARAHPAWGARTPVIVDDSSRVPRWRRPDAPGDALTAKRVRGVHAGLGHAVALQDRMTRSIAKFGEGLGEKRRRTRYEQANMTTGLPVEAFLREEPRIEGRHAHHNGRVRQEIDGFFGVELRQPKHPAARKQYAMPGDEQSVHVIDGKRVQQHISATESPLFDQR